MSDLNLACMTAGALSSDGDRPTQATAVATNPALRTFGCSTEHGDPVTTQKCEASDRKEAILKYLPPFDVIKQSVELSTSKGQLVATASYENLIKMIKLLLSSVDVDEKWYLSSYPDVAEAIGQGMATSARQHFIDNGYFEGRLPFAINVDEKWYQKQYPDVAESIKKGGESSAQAHFNRDGYKEGREPFPT